MLRIQSKPTMLSKSFEFWKCYADSTQSVPYPSWDTSISDYSIVLELKERNKFQLSKEVQNFVKCRRLRQMFTYLRHSLSFKQRHVSPILESELEWCKRRFKIDGVQYCQLKQIVKFYHYKISLNNQIRNLKNENFSKNSFVSSLWINVLEFFGVFSNLGQKSNVFHGLTQNNSKSPLGCRFGPEFSSDNSGDGPAVSKFTDLPPYSPDDFNLWSFQFKAFLPAGYINVLNGKETIIRDTSDDSSAMSKKQVEDLDVKHAREFLTKRRFIYQAIVYALGKSSNPAQATSLVTAVDMEDGVAAWEAISSFHNSPTAQNKL